MGKNSPIQQMKDYLENGGSFTKIDGIRRFGYLNIGDAVLILRRAPHSLPIKTEMVTRNGKRVAEYSLNTPANGN